MNLLVHKFTQKSVDSFISRPSHALILEGAKGSGKLYLASLIAQKLLNAPEIINNPRVLVVKPINGMVTIDQIRETQNFVKLKTTGEKAIRRIVLINIDGKITTEAQNAFLKVLEEPPSDTVIIVTVESATMLLSTINSRAQHIKVHPITLNQAFEYYKKLDYDDTEILSSYSLAEAKSEYLNLLLTDSTNTIKEIIKDVKKFLTDDSYNRLITITKYSKDKQNLEQFIKSLIIISGAGLDTSAKNNEIVKIKRWHQIIKTSLLSEEQLHKNTNTKLLSTYLSLVV